MWAEQVVAELISRFSSWDSEWGVVVHSVAIRGIDVVEVTFSAAWVGPEVIRLRVDPRQPFLTEFLIMGDESGRLAGEYDPEDVAFRIAILGIGEPFDRTALLTLQNGELERAMQARGI